MQQKHYHLISCTESEVLGSSSLLHTGDVINMCEHEVDVMVLRRMITSATKKEGPSLIRTGDRFVISIHLRTLFCYTMTHILGCRWKLVSNIYSFSSHQYEYNKLHRAEIKVLNMQQMIYIIYVYVYMYVCGLWILVSV